MIQARHRTLYTISGIIWLAIGVMLLDLGLKLVMHGFQGQEFIHQNYSALFYWLSSYTGGYEYTACVLIALSLVIGFSKGRFVMQKAAMKSYDRISKLSNPTSITNIYTKSNLLLIGCMMGLGMLMKTLALPFDIRGSIDTAVGCALMQGSMAYFRLLKSPVQSA